MLGCVIVTIDYRAVRRSSSIIFNWPGKNDHGFNIVALVVDYIVAASSFFSNAPEYGLGEELTETDHHVLNKTLRRVFCYGRGYYSGRYVDLQHAAVGTRTGSWVGCGSVDG